MSFSQRWWFNESSVFVSRQLCAQCAVSENRPFKGRLPGVSHDFWSLCVFVREKGRALDEVREGSAHHTKSEVGLAFHFPIKCCVSANVSSHELIRVLMLLISHKCLNKPIQFHTASSSYTPSRESCASIDLWSLWVYWSSPSRDTPHSPTH